MHIRIYQIWLSLFSFFIMISAQNIDLKGKIVNYKGNAITGATVKLLKNGLKTKTDSKGNFALKATENNVEKTHSAQNMTPPHLTKNRLVFSLTKKEYVSVAMYTINGKKIHTLFQSNLEKGTHSIEYNPRGLSSQTILISLSLGSSLFTFKQVLAHNKFRPLSQTETSNPQTRAAGHLSTGASRTFAVDTLKIVGKMSKIKKMPIESYIMEYPNIKLSKVQCGRCHIE